MEEYTLALKTSSSANLKFWLHLRFTHNICVLPRTNHHILPQNHFLWQVCSGEHHSYQRVKSKIKREARERLPSWTSCDTVQLKILNVFLDVNDH